MGFVNFLSAFGDVNRFSTIRGYILNLLRQLISVARLKEEQRLRREIIHNSRSVRCDRRLSQREIFEDARRRVDVGESISLVRNYAYIAQLDFVDKFFQLSWSEELHAIREA